jgi:SAM-dependent methyltransferase
VETTRDDAGVEGYGPATYGEAFADVYDDWYGDLEGLDDAVATIGWLAAGDRVLELGVGSGRLAVPLAAAGAEVWGLDASPAMLDRLATRPGGDRVRVALGDMADPSPVLEAAGGRPGDGFAVVVLAFNTFFLLATADAQQGCLAAAARLLAPGGCLAIEAYVPADPPADADTVLEPRAVELDRVVFTVSTHRPAEQVVHGQHVEIRESGIRLRPWVLRYLRPEQLDELAGEVGLRLLERWGSWDRRPFSDASPLHVSVYVAG